MNKPGNNYWKSYFTNDPNFWSYIQWLNSRLQDKISSNNTYNLESYVREGFNKPSLQELLFSNNYLQNQPFPNEKMSEIYGKNLDLYQPLISKTSVKKIYDINDIFTIFTNPVKPTLDLDYKTVLYPQIFSKSKFQTTYTLKNRFIDLKENFYFFKKKKQYHKFLN